MARGKTASPRGATLFEAATHAAPIDATSVPLAERMRPRSLGDLVGQERLVGDASPLARAIREDKLRSFILWGPPGSGKTTLARVVADTSRADFVALNAVLAGVADVREVVAKAREARAYSARRTILFVDEIHRFNKSQQDALLPHVEDGTVVLIGATTENPSFAVVAPLLSRCKVYRLELLDERALAEVLGRAVAAPTGLDARIDVAPEVIAAIARSSQGDARRALTSLEIAADDASTRGASSITLEDLVRLGDHAAVRHDKSGEDHYNVISAFIKSMRGSDPDASIYWFMRMIEAGDDVLFVLRRMIIFASEDVGNADPRALEIALAADAAFRRLGMPEALYPMSQAVTYLATAPKSNRAGMAWQGAQRAVREHGALDVPLKLRNAPTALMKREGYGADYRYAHDEPDAVARGEVYLPDRLVGERYYVPADRGYEKTIGERQRLVRGEAASPPDPTRPPRDGS